MIATRKQLILGAILAGAAAAVPAVAHHSAAMFDDEAVWTFTGDVHEFQYTNPHSWLVLNIASIQDAEGNDVPLDGRARWGFEAEGPTRVMILGITKDDFNPGEPVKITGHPMRDGRPGAEWLCATKTETGEEICARR